MIKKLLETAMINCILGTIWLCVLAAIFFLIFPEIYDSGEWFPFIILLESIFFTLCFSFVLFLYSIFKKQDFSFVKEKSLFVVFPLLFLFGFKIILFDWYLPNDFLPRDLEIFIMFFNIILFYFVILYFYFKILKFIKKYKQDKNRK